MDTAKDKKRAVVCGGYRGAGTKDSKIETDKTCQAYDFKSNKWDDSVPDLPVSLSGAASVPFGDSFLTVSGHTGYSYIKSVFWLKDGEKWVKFDEDLGQGPVRVK